MVPIPVYSASPITAAKPSGVTPKTATPADAGQGGQGQHRAEACTAVASAAYPPVAQPGALPSLPKQTAMPYAGDVLPTPTQNSSVLTGNPPLPQPGAAPIPPGHSGFIPLPPPQNTGESAKGQQAAPLTTMPPQTGYQPPQSAYLSAQGPSSVSTAAPPTLADTAGTTATSLLQGQHPSAGHSPAAGGCQQDANAAGYSQYRPSTAAYEDQDEAGVWDTAKKWVASAGEGLAAAEKEIWKRINKD